MTAREQHTEEQIDNAATWLRELPDAPKTKKVATSRMEVVRRLRDEIHAALKRGYDHSQIAEGLAKHGVRISATTLKNYLQRAKPGATKKSRKSTGDSPRKNAATESPATAERPAPSASAKKEETHGRTRGSENERQGTTAKTPEKNNEAKPKRQYDADNASFTPPPDRERV